MATGLRTSGSAAASSIVNAGSANRKEARSSWGVSGCDGSAAAVAKVTSEMAAAPKAIPDTGMKFEARACDDDFILETELLPERDLGCQRNIRRQGHSSVHRARDAKGPGKRNWRRANRR